MNCDDFARILHPFLDGELEVAAQVAAQEHCAGCAACAARVASYRRLGVLVRDAASTTLPASLLQRAQELQQRTLARQRARRRRRWLAAAAAVVVATAGIVLWSTQDHGLDPEDVREVAELQHRSQLPGHLVDLQTSQAAQLAPWFAGKVPFRPWVGASRPEYTWVGARLDYCDHQIVAVTVLRYQQHLVNIVSYPSDGGHDHAPGVARWEDVSCCGWSQGGIQVFVASDLPVAEVERLAGLLRG